MRAEIGEDFCASVLRFFRAGDGLRIDINIQLLIPAAYRVSGESIFASSLLSAVQNQGNSDHSIPVLVKLQFHLLRTIECFTQIVPKRSLGDTPRCAKTQPRTRIRPLIVEMYWNGPRAVGFQRLTESV